MNANRRELILFPRITDAADMRRLMKNGAASAAHGHGRIGRRVAPGSTAAALSDRNDGWQVFQQHIRVYSRLKSVFIRVPSRRRHRTIRGKNNKCL
jgi:hypothetical protein